MQNKKSLRRTRRIDELLDAEKLRMCMAKLRVTQVALSILLDEPCTTLNGWLACRHPAPVDLAARIENALGLEPGALSIATSDTGRAHR